MESSTQTPPESSSGDLFGVTESVTWRPFDETATAISAAFVIPMAVFGVFANVVTIRVIYCSPKLKSIFNYFLMSLCVSDLISALNSPLFVYRRTWGFDYWYLSSFLCKVFWSNDHFTSVLTALHILMYSGLRLLAITFPHFFKRISITHSKVCIFLLWVIAIGCGYIPFSIWMDALHIDRITYKYKAPWPSCTITDKWLSHFQTYNTIGSIFFFYIPMFLVILFSGGVCIIISLQRAKRVKGKSSRQEKNEVEVNRQKKELQAFFQLMLIVGSFMIGYIPYTAYMIFASSLQNQTKADHTFLWWFGTTQYITLRISECLNPVFYNLGSSKMRQETIYHLKRLFHCTTEAPPNNSTSMTTVTQRISSKV